MVDVQLADMESTGRDLTLGAMMNVIYVKYAPKLNGKKLVSQTYFSQENNYGHPSVHRNNSDWNIHLRRSMGRHTGLGQAMVEPLIEDPEYDDICTDEPYYRIEKIEYMHCVIATWVTFIDTDGIRRQYRNPHFTSIKRLEKLFRRLDISVHFDEYLPIITAHRETRNYVVEANHG